MGKVVTFMKKNWIAITIILVVALGAGLGFKGCSAKQQQDFRTSVKIGAASTRETRGSINDFCRAELIKAESCTKVQPILDRAATTAARLDMFVDAHPKLTFESKLEVLAMIDDLLKEVDALDADGLIEFKNPDRRKKFLLGLAAAKTFIRIARVSVEVAPVEAAPTPTPAPSPTPSTSPTPSPSVR